jgi:Protein of unknown function (DUF1625).
MAYTVTTKQGYGKRVGNSFKGIGSGIALFIIGTALLWWNEGNTVKSTRALNEASGVTVEMPDITQVNPEFEGKLVHAVGQAMTGDVLNDDLFGITVNAMALSRSVEYFQWVETSSSETKEKIGGGTETVTTYEYNREWTYSPVNSANFQDPDYQAVNSVLTTVEGKAVRAENVTFGAYRLPGFLKSGISGSQAITPEPTDAQKEEWLKVIRAKDPEANFIINGNTVYLGASPDNPRVGDVRITFDYVPTPQTISILAKVIGDTFEEYTAKNGKTVSRMAMGEHSTESMYESAHKEVGLLKWLLRILGILLIVGGLKSIFDFISMVFAVVPFVKNLLSKGIGFVCWVIGLIWSFLIIGLAWIFYRPAVGIPLLVAAVALLVLLIVKKKNKPLPEAPAAPEVPQE